jgi:hypothetical protein
MKKSPRHPVPGLPQAPLQETAMSDRTGNEPAPLMLIGVAVIPIIAVLAWLAF